MKLYLLKFASFRLLQSLWFRSYIWTLNTQLPGTVFKAENVAFRHSGQNRLKVLKRAAAVRLAIVPRLGKAVCFWGDTFCCRPPSWRCKRSTLHSPLSTLPPDASAARLVTQRWSPPGWIMHEIRLQITPYQYAILITMLKLPLNSYEYVEKCRGLI